VVLLPGRLDRLSDDALLAALVLGDRDGAAVFVRRFQKKVYGLAWIITNDRVVAEDVAQMAFERAWRHGATFDPRRASVSTWLLTITRNLAIDSIRANRTDAIDPIQLLNMLPPSVDRDPALAAVQADTLGRLRPCLDALPIEQRRAVLLATLAGRSTTEISEIEGIPVPTAKTRLRTGLAKLTENMREHEAGGERS
jgi:RNA polymerase sigma factor (sigma-70 family)